MSERKRVVILDAANLQSHVPMLWQKHVDEFVAVFASSNESSRFDATAAQYRALAEAVGAPIGAVPRWVVRALSKCVGRRVGLLRILRSMRSTRRQAVFCAVRVRLSLPESPR